MDTLTALFNGFATAITPINLLWCLVGTTLGTAIGILPGIGPALTIALLLPVTAAFLWRIHVEENALRDGLGEDYRIYATRTKRLIPFVY